MTVPLSRYINEHPMEKEIFVSIGGEMAVMNKRMVESEANLYDREARAGISNRTAPGWIPAAAYRTCPAFSSEAYVHVGTKFLNADRDVMKEMGTS